jgi:type IV secretion system protein TrbI
MADSVPGTAPVTDHRIAPRGVLPRGMQTWLMIGLALGILAIIVLTGQPEPASPNLAPAMSQVLTPNPERLRDYQDRLRVLDQRARQQAVTDPPPSTPQPAYDDPPATATPDPFEAERKRREYESLFASNVVVSRRPDTERPVTDDRARTQTLPSRASEQPMPSPPSIDDVADAVIRATTRYATPAVPPLAGRTPERAHVGSMTNVSAPASPVGGGRPSVTERIPSTDLLHRILEGTVIETVLTNRLDGSGAAPVNCLVTTPVYAHDRQVVVIPAGSRVLGETKPVQTFGETRLAVTFTRLVLPDGRTHRLEQFLGLNDIGDAGLRDQVNQHYRSTFGASAAVGLLTGFAQSLGSAGVNRGSGDRTVVIAGNVGDATAQAAAQTMNRFLNRLPTVTIREGHRVKVYLTSDLELPAYDVRDRARQPRLAGNR